MNVFTKTFFRIMLAALAAIVVEQTFNVGQRIRNLLNM